MSARCEYCGGAGQAAEKCVNCGAPAMAPATDFRSCPHCRRKLLSLASAHCNRCGRPLPGDYIAARAAQLRRINEINPPSKQGDDDEHGDDVDLTFSF